MVEMTLKMAEKPPILRSILVVFSGFWGCNRAREVSLFGENTLKRDNAGKSGRNTLILEKYPKIERNGPLFGPGRPDFKD